MESKGKDLTIRFRASDMEREMIEEIAAHLDTDMSGAIRKLITVAHTNMVINRFSADILYDRNEESGERFESLLDGEHLFAPLSARLITAKAHMNILEALRGNPILFDMVAAYLDTKASMAKIADDLQAKHDEDKGVFDEIKAEAEKAFNEHQNRK